MGKIVADLTPLAEKLLILITYCGICGAEAILEPAANEEGVKIIWSLEQLLDTSIEDIREATELLIRKKHIRKEKGRAV